MVIPAYKVSQQILPVVNSIGPEVSHIIVIDDFCPEKSGLVVSHGTKDTRVEVLYHDANQGVGGSVKTGYKHSLSLGADIVIKIDGDGQMDPRFINELISPIIYGGYGYAKGNRFFEIEAIKAMPKLRVFGNLGLTFMTKLSTGYWQIFDPNNGFTAISSTVLRRLPLEKIDNRYFFESDMLFRLNVSRVNVADVSISAIYSEEISNLKIRRVLVEFPLKHFRNFVKRIIYSYYIREFTLASIELPTGVALLSFGGGVGIHSWISSLQSGTTTSAGTAVLGAMSILGGLQLVLAFFSYDIANSTTKSYVKSNLLQSEKYETF